MKKHDIIRFLLRHQRKNTPKPVGRKTEPRTNNLYDVESSAIPAFQVEQMALDLQTSEISAHASVDVYDPVAGNDDRQWVVPAGRTDSSRSTGNPDLCRDFTIGGRRSVGNIEQRLPYPHCESAAVSGDRQGKGISAP